MVYEVLDIARYIINYNNQHGCGISNLKLQKILYFVQAAFLVNKSEPCFYEDIEAWDFGPVVPEIYHEFKMYGSNDIPHINDYIDYSKGIWEAKKVIFNENIISGDDKKLLDNMIEQCNQHSANDLVRITHGQAPWQNAYNRGFNNIISKESIKNFFIKG